MASPTRERKKALNFRKEYVFVDIHGQAAKQWKRVRLEDVPRKLLEPSNNYKCFQSIQRYSSETHEAEEIFWMPIFFDFDAAGDPGKCIADVQKLLVYLADILQIHKQYARVWFSGSKGFHVIIDPEVFDIRPNKKLHLTVKRATMLIAEMLGLATYDPVVYSRRRVLRIPNTLHEKTRLHKIELDHSDLNLGMEAILEMAKRPRPPLWPEVEELDPIEEAKEFWDARVAEAEEVRELVNLRPDKQITATPGLPVCMEHLLNQTALPTPNTGNRTILSMATYLKDAGKPEAEAIAILVPWACRLTNIGGAGDVAMLTASVTATIKYVYHRGADQKEEGYRFACKYILALSNGENKIPCQGTHCPAIKGKMQQTKEVIKLPLADFSKAPYMGEKVQVQTLISGKNGTPYVVPRRLRLTCTKDSESGDFCKGCPAARFNGEMSFDYSASDPEVLEIINCSNADQWGAIKRKCKIPTCSGANLKVEESMNVEEVRMSPAAVDISNFEKNEFVNRKGFFVGYPIESNRRYELTGFPVKEPKTQTSAFIFEEKAKLETDVEAFKMTPEVYEELKVFQVPADSDVEGKWREIHNDLSNNVYRIWDRMDLAWAVDLVAHSVRSFKFRNEPFVKGWAELLVIGDSGQGKTAIVRRLVQAHYRVGDLIDGGSARRTGLLYSYQENGKGWLLQWGALPQNDLGLVTIDEFGDLPDDQFASMTSVRSSGIVRATGVVTAETFARVRLIAITNCKKGRHLAEYEFPVTAIKEIVPAAEDIRRFDFAVAVASGEVSADVINRSDVDTVEHKYVAHACANLVRWAWSRKEDNVIFEPDASIKILDMAKQMSKDFFAGEIPLVEPADQRHKIARLSAACAARVFSTDETGEQVIVKVQHVEFVTDFLYSCYYSSNLKYGMWSQEQRRTDVGQDMETTMTTLKQNPDWRLILGVLMMPGQIDQREFEGLLKDRSKGAAAINTMRLNGLLERKYGKYFKTARGLRLPEYAISKSHITKDEIEKALMGQGPENFFSQGRFQ